MSGPSHTDQTDYEDSPDEDGFDMRHRLYEGPRDTEYEKKALGRKTLSEDKTYWKTKTQNANRACVLMAATLRKSIDAKFSASSSPAERLSLLDLQLRILAASHCFEDRFGVWKAVAKAAEELRMSRDIEPPRPSTVRFILLHAMHVIPRPEDIEIIKSNIYNIEALRAGSGSYGWDFIDLKVLLEAAEDTKEVSYVAEVLDLGKVDLADESKEELSKLLTRAARRAQEAYTAPSEYNWYSSALKTAKKLHLGKWNIDDRLRVALLVESVIDRVKQAARTRAARIIQHRWLEYIYRPNSSSKILRGARRRFIHLSKRRKLSQE